MIRMAAALLVVLKALLFTLLSLVLPVVLHNFLVEYLTEFVEWLLSHVLPRQDIVLSFTGLTAWFFDVLRLPDVVLSVLAWWFIAFVSRKLSI